MYRNNHIYKVYSERPADLFHFYSGIVMVGTLFATHHGGDGVSSYSTVERHGGDAMAERRNDAPHPCGNYLSFRVHAVPWFTLVLTIDSRMSFFLFLSIFFLFTNLFHSLI